MKRANITLFSTLAAFVVGLAACSSPSLHTLSVPESLAQDDGLVGEWAAEGPDTTRVLVKRGPSGRYSGTLTIANNPQLKSGLDLEISLTEIDGDMYVDLYLSKAEREGLVGRFGFLVLPVHQFMMFQRDSDTVKVWPFNANWVDRTGSESAFPTERFPVGGGEVSVITADSDALRGFLRAHAHDPGALSRPLVFRRVGAVYDSARRLSH